jgi:hypothetical protein
MILVRTPVTRIESDHLLDDFQRHLVVAFRAADVRKQQQRLYIVRLTGKYPIERGTGLLRQVEREPRKGHADDRRGVLRFQVTSRLVRTHRFP